MKLAEKILELAQKQGGMVLARQVALVGVSRQMLHLYVRRGLLEHIEHGVYATPNGVVDDLFLTSLRVPTGVFSHGTALFLNGLTDRTPFTPTMTISTTRVLTQSLRKAIDCFYVPETHLKMGLVMRTTPLGNTIPTYDCERTICDLIRSRKRLDEELVMDGLRQYAQWKQKDIARLGEYAVALGVLDEVRRTLEVAL